MIARHPEDLSGSWHRFDSRYWSAWSSCTVTRECRCQAARHSCRSCHGTGRVFAGRYYRAHAQLRCRQCRSGRWRWTGPLRCPCGNPFVNPSPAELRERFDASRMRRGLLYVAWSHPRHLSDGPRPIPYRPNLPA
jgi:hypothetical protein